MLKGLTVQYLLRRTRRGAEPGDAILWHAAAGGVGLIACQWARALGFVVIATAGSPEKCELARAAGAHHVIDYRREDVVARVRELTGGRGVPVVYDGVGKDTFERSLDCLAPLGLLVSFGSASGPVAPVSLGVLMQKGSLYVQRPTLATHTRTRRGLEDMSGELFAMLESGQVKVDAPRSYPLADAARAHRDLEARATTGSSVLVP
jgi:NADPH2:quinone reductase